MTGRVQAVRPEIQAPRSRAHFFVAPAFEAALLAQAGESLRFLVHQDLGPGLGPSGDPGNEPQARKLRRVNECVDGYEPGGRRFESCRARQQHNNLQLSQSCSKD